MIPKIIHYCWFGGREIPQNLKNCIESWNKFCPDYEIIQWNEKNYDISRTNSYVKEAIAEKKWAFVTDYVRLDVVYKYGGIYLDTDVELIKSLDDLLQNEAFFGREKDGFIATGLGFGACKGSNILDELMKCYTDIHFVKRTGVFDFMPCPQRNRPIFKKYGFSNVTDKIENNGTIVVFPHEYFCPKGYGESTIDITENTYSIHHYDASWKDRELQDKNNNKLCVSINCFFKKIDTLFLRFCRILKRMGGRYG